MDELLLLLEDLDKCIVGKYVVWGGLMLGLHRDNKPLHWDKDIDICLIDDAYIDYDKLPESIGTQQYYMHEKIYRKGHKIFKPGNRWSEYVSYIRMLPENVGLNRAQLFKIAKETYYQDYIDPEFTEVFIDIDRLSLDSENQYKNKYFPKCYFLKKEIESIQYIDYEDYSIPVPTYLDDICCRHYGKNWDIPDPAWKY